ncbi:MAG: iron-containing alcohol dehydrogenase [Deltaproteobacteria bacterium]|nr:iron-containing alcohol dehydrogenase [Deltaproteobacteria bacterium]
MAKNILEGEDILIEEFKKESNYVLVTMEEPYSIIQECLNPKHVIFNYDMSEENLMKLASNNIEGDVIYGFGGGTACDTAKYLATKWNRPLIITPSVISVDAWLCKQIAIRTNGRVRYIDGIKPDKFILDYSIIRKGPGLLNKAGVSDVLSITTALGDWNISRRVFGDRFDISYYNAAYNIAKTLLSREKDISELSTEGLRSIVMGQVEEVILCEEWGNSRPEEGGEHFLAYCLEEITKKHYIHGLLIALNIIVVLKLQRDEAVFDYESIYQFYKNIGLDISPQKQGITEEEYRKTLLATPRYVKEENLFNGIFSLKSIYDSKGEYSVNEIVDWVFSL